MCLSSPWCEAEARCLGPRQAWAPWRYSVQGLAQLCPGLGRVSSPAEAKARSATEGHSSRCQGTRLSMGTHGLGVLLTLVPAPGILSRPFLAGPGCPHHVCTGPGLGLWYWASENELRVDGWYVHTCCRLTWSANVLKGAPNSPCSSCSAALRALCAPFPGRVSGRWHGVGRRTDGAGCPVVPPAWALSTLRAPSRLLGWWW